VAHSVTLTYNHMDLPADAGQSLTIWTAEPRSKSAEALRFLASWASTPDPAAKAAHHSGTPHSGH
jgi:hypothetical protein